MFELTPTIAPTQLPELQARLVDKVDPDVAQRIMEGTASRRDTFKQIAHLAVGIAHHRYYGSADFCTLVESAWEGLPTPTFEELAEVPDAGVLYFAEPIRKVQDIHAWEDIRMIVWNRVDYNDRTVDPDAIQFFFWGYDMPIDLRTVDRRPGKAHTGDGRFLQVFYAAWLLLQQRDLVETEEVRKEIRSKKIKRRLGGKKPPAVTVVDLRRSSTGESAAQDDEGRKYQHRWVVNGHWRNQPCGPGRQDRRRIYVLPHIKGPEGAPMLESKKVYHW